MSARLMDAHERAGKPETGFVEKPMTRGRTGSEAGFSLVELLVAMTITLIISGAIYGLLSGGQSAFRREPELTDRQQNARIAMSVIMRDIANAGSGLPPFVQTFTRSLDGPTGAPLNAANTATDELEMVTNTGGRENEPVCTAAGGTATIRLLRAVDTTSIPANTVVLVLMSDGTYAIRNINSIANNTGTFGTGCTGSGSPGHATPDLTATGDPTGLNRPSVCTSNGLDTNTTALCVPTAISFATIVRYRIRNDASGVPVLQRFSSDDPQAFASGAVSSLGFQTIARGIEDLQIKYTTPASATFADGAPLVVNGTYTSLINQVRVELVARSEARNIQGARTSASGRVNIRGSLVSIGTPRSTLIQLANAPVASPAPHVWF